MTKDKAVVNSFSHVHCTVLFKFNRQTHKDINLDVTDHLCVGSVLSEINDQ